MLKRLIQSSQSQGDYCHNVISLTTFGEVGRYLKSIGIQVYELKMKSVLDVPSAFFRLIRLIKSIKPDVVQTWMYHADLLGGIASRFAGIHNIFWNIRNTEIPQRTISKTSLIIRICALLSRTIPRKIICCAHAGVTSHAKLGYDVKRMLVIPNGFDICSWSLPTQSRYKIRETYGFPVDSFIVGTVGRFDSLKGYDVLIEAGSLIAKSSRRPFLFLMVGRNVNNQNFDLLKLIERKGGQANFRLLGEREDISQIMYALDVYCLSSKAEGFPNVVAEAMLMETPCVVTDVGDAARIVGSLGKVVSPRDPSRLAEALLEMERMSKNELKDIGRNSRKQIANNYDIEAIAQVYKWHYET